MMARRDVEREPRSVVVGRRGVHTGEAGAGLGVHEAAGLLLLLGSDGAGQADVQSRRGRHDGTAVDAEGGCSVHGRRLERQRCGEWLARWQSFHSKHSVSVRDQLHEQSDILLPLQDDEGEPT